MPDDGIQIDAPAIDGSIVIVGGEAAEASALRMLLGANGLASHHFRDAATMLTGLEGLDPRLIITDMELPDGDGATLAAIVRERTSGTLPVIVLGRPGDVASSVLAIQAGAVTFLEKPFFHDSLMRRVMAMMIAGSNSPIRWETIRPGT